MIEAKIICDSINPTGQRLTTFQLRYPKFIHAEFMTHRVFSRNASSSRAVPTKRLLEEVRSDKLRAAPVFWGKNQAGMQATDELNSKDYNYDNPYEPYGPKLTAMTRARITWDQAARHAADFAQEMMDVGAHKQIINRLLEPFTHINVVCTATEYMNFFGLRLDKAAQPEMRVLTEAMWVAYQESCPNKLNVKQWHLPFVDGLFASDIADWIEEYKQRLEYETWEDIAIRISVARCARVSYMSNETGKRSTVEEDLVLYERLLGSQPLHASPAEHQATPDSWVEEDRMNASLIGGCWRNQYEQANFVGWRQYRKSLSGENCAALPEEYL